MEDLNTTPRYEWREQAEADGVQVDRRSADRSRDIMPKKDTSPATRKTQTKANGNGTPPVPASPVLHGLKVGCKRRLEDCNPLHSGGTPGMARNATKSAQGGIHEHLGRTTATLVLSDGTRLKGFSFGAERSTMIIRLPMVTLEPVVVRSSSATNFS